MDHPWDIDDGQSGHNTYGHHPMYLAREKSNKFHIVYFRNSNAMDIIVDENENNKDYPRSVTYKTIGGVLDFKIFLGDTA